MPRLSGRCLLDTNVLVYATTLDDPRRATAMDLFNRARGGEFDAVVSVQNLAEMYPNLTGPKRKPPDSPALARRKIESIAGLRFVEVLAVTDKVLFAALELCERHGTRRQDYFDMQLAAAMQVNDVTTLITENATDFPEIGGIRVVDPFK
jgi:predicted nucleic acid-binding protein